MSSDKNTKESKKDKAHEAKEKTQLKGKKKKKMMSSDGYAMV